MKHLLNLLFCITLINAAKAQIGPGIEFDYNNGYRVLRQYNSFASLAKPGKDINGSQADTVIGYISSEKKEIKNRIFVKAYPNPVKDVLFVENRSWKEGSRATLKLYDISGKVLLEKTTTQPKENIDMNMLPTGNYYIKYYVGYTYLISWKITKL